MGLFAIGEARLPYIGCFCEQAKRMSNMCHVPQQVSVLGVPLLHCVLPAGILYHDMYASDLVGTHVEMRSLEVSDCATCIDTAACSNSARRNSFSLLSPGVFRWLASVYRPMSAAL